MTTAKAASVPLPNGFGIELDGSVKQLDSQHWFGGSPARVVKLTPSGRAVWRELRQGPVGSRPAGQLARRLTDAGLAHPRPPAHAVTGEVTVLIPAFGRPDALDRCLSALDPAVAVVVVDDGSHDADAVAKVAAAHGVRLVRREINGGPAAARNTGLAVIDTEFVAFLDSDCVPTAGWLAPLLAHLADPLVGAVAPRICALTEKTVAGRYTASRGSLDLGPRPGRVVANARVSYVPTAALIARRQALAAIARAGYVFDPALRVGEDVDLVWRLDAAGWRVRYDPSVRVEHAEPDSWQALLGRRMRYGTSAAPLAIAHPGAAVPLVVHTWPTLTVLGLLARRPGLAGVAYTVSVVKTVRRLRAAGVPPRGSAWAMASAAQQTWIGLGRYATQVAAPLLVASMVHRGGFGRRAAAASLLLGPPLTAWWQRGGQPGGLDPARFTTAYLADELAYGAGVVRGSVQHRSLAALRPRLARAPRPDAGSFPASAVFPPHDSSTPGEN